MLAPVSAQAKMKRNTTPLPLRTASNPRLHFDIKLEKIPVSLSEAQYRGLVAWMKEFSRHNKRRLYRKWRPTCKIKDRCYIIFAFIYSSWGMSRLSQRPKYKTDATVFELQWSNYIAAVREY